MTDEEFKAPVKPPLRIVELQERYMRAVKVAHPRASVTELAKAVGVHPATLYRLIKKWGWDK